MGKAVFQTEIIELGEQVDAFFEEGHQLESQATCCS